jgi:putative ABC transport system substrate-binding protein
VNRRDFITLLGGAAAWPLAARAQQPAMPVVGFLNPASPDARGELIAAFHQGLAEAGYVERRNVAVEYRWAPAAAEIAFLRNPTNPYFSAPETRELQAAAAVLGVRLLHLNASGPHEIEVAFANLVTQRAGGFLLGTDPFFITARDQLVALANRHAVPAIYPFREDAAAGGLRELWCQQS